MVFSMRTPFRTVSAVLALVALSLSLAEGLVASSCALEMCGPGFVAATDAPSDSGGPELRERPDHSGQGCPFDSAAQGCAFATSLPSPEPAVADVGSATVAPSFQEPAAPGAFLGDALFHPPRG